MENCLHHHRLTNLTLPSSSPPHKKPHIGFFSRPIGAVFSSSLYHRCRPFSRVKVKASAGASHCQFSSLNSPLEPRSLVGKFLSGVLQNHRQLFHVAVGEELKLLSDDRDAALARMLLGSASDEALLHRFGSFEVDTHSRE